MMEPEDDIKTLCESLEKDFFIIRDDFLLLKERILSIDPSKLHRKPVWVSRELKKFENLVDGKLSNLEKLDIPALRAGSSDPHQLELLDFAEELIGNGYPGVLKSLSTYATDLIEYHLDRRSPKGVMEDGLNCCETQFEMQGFLLKNFQEREK